MQLMSQNSPEKIQKWDTFDHPFQLIENRVNKFGQEETKMGHFSAIDGAICPIFSPELY
jgi:hypothetical protein